MPDLTLQEALQTDEVKTFIGAIVREALDEHDDALETRITEAVDTAVDAKLPTIRESVSDDVRRDGQLRTLHTEAVRIIEASTLKGAARTNLLEDYGLDGDGEDATAGRALRVIEAELDDDGNVVKTAKAVLAEQLDEDIKRARNVIRESGPSVPRAPGGGSEDGTPTPTRFGGAESNWAQRMREKGLDPADFGATPEPAKTT